MKKIVIIVCGWVMASSAFAFTTQQFHNDNANKALRGFQVLSAPGVAKRGTAGEKAPVNELIVKRARTYQEDTRQFTTTYYQYYQGIRVLDGEVTVHELKTGNKTRDEMADKKVIGQLLQNIDISSAEMERFNSAENLDKALADAKAEFFQKRRENAWDISHDQANLVLKNDNGKLKLLYEVVFYAKAKKHAPILYHAFLDPGQRNKVIKSWNGVMNYFADKGPGGNNKTKEYHYGVEGVPFLNVNKQSGKCILDDKTTKLLVVDMSTENPELDRYYKFMKPYAYQCNSEARDTVQGAYSAADDAYYFGHLVQQVYQEWYNTKVLDLPKVALRVHYSEYNGETFDNAFWDSVSSTMNFGDGTADVTGNDRGKHYGFYPFVSLDVTAHEMSHGFTNAHSNLQYHDESGALNEAFSDMAGMVAVTYLHEKAPQLYQAIYHNLDLNWSFGTAIMRNPDPRVALRYMDRPARDGMSAECYQSVPGCAISYGDLQNFVTQHIENEDEQQSVIVHCGSGIYNRFFYLLASTSGWDVKKAFNLMLVSNRDGYWTENSNFENAACQTLQAAKDLAYDTVAVKNAFKKVGIDTATCDTNPTLH